MDHFPANRFRNYRLHPQDVLAVLTDWKENEYIAVAKIEGIPADAHVVGVHADPNGYYLLLRVYHPEFDIVPFGADIPTVDCTTASLQVIRLRREDSSPNASYLIPAGALD